MPLTDTTIRNAKPQTKQIKLFDGGGLFLLVTPKGGRLWRLKYRFCGKEKLLSLGVYPDVGLKEARGHREEAREILAQGIDPGEQKKETKAALAAEKQSRAATFETVRVSDTTEKLPTSLLITKGIFYPGSKSSFSPILEASLSLCWNLPTLSAL